MLISCIICSRYPDVSYELKQNIASTIGCEYELIVIDNSRNQYTIFSAYNEGVRRSKGDILCFMHEDILFHGNNWGSVVQRLFKNNETLGLLGVEGSHYMSKYASPWWSACSTSGQLIQGNTENGKYFSKYEQLWSRRESGIDSIQVVAVDGLWMCIKRPLFDKGLIRFDDKSFNGFHCYDADICLQVIKTGFEVRVAYDILIEHKSLGNPDIRYFKQLDIWYEKWKDMLPLIKGVEMFNVEREERERICKRYTDLFRNNEVLIDRLNNVHKSNAYRVGKIIMTPFRFFTSVLKRYKI